MFFYFVPNLVVARWGKKTILCRFDPGEKWNATPERWAIGRFHHSGPLTVVPVSGRGGPVRPSQILSASTSALNIASRPMTLYKFSLFFHSPPFTPPPTPTPLQPLQHFQKGKHADGMIERCSFQDCLLKQKGGCATKIPEISSLVSNAAEQTLPLSLISMLSLKPKMSAFMEMDGEKGTPV